MKINNSPTVTVYITNYNYEKYLEKAIQSVICQTFQDLELIIIDDGSTDGSREIIKKYENNEKIYTVFQQNKGLNRTNNVALKLASGKYIMRLDADDYLDPNALEVMVQKLERFPECVLVFPDYYIVDEQENIIRQVRRHDFNKEVSLFDQPAHGACTLIRRDVLLKLGGYDENFRCQDCYDIWLKIIQKYKVVNINLPLFYYRQHDKSLTKKEEKILRTRAKIKAKHVKNRGVATPSVLAILPIRGRNVDPRSLPLAELGGKNLIDWSLEAALGSKSVSAVMVSTPDLNVQEYVRRKYSGKVMVVKRTKELARINIPLEQSLLEALKYYLRDHVPPDLLLILFIEAPFRSSEWIDEAVNTMQLFDVDVVDGICPEDDIFYFHNGHGLKPWNLNSGLRLEREILYRRAGGLHLIRRDFLESEQNMLSGRIGHIILDHRAAFTIRLKMDWEIARYLVEKGE